MAYALLHTGVVEIPGRVVVRRLAQPVIAAKTMDVPCKRAKVRSCKELCPATDDALDHAVPVDC